MKKTLPVTLIIFLTTAPLLAGNGGIVNGYGGAEDKKYVSAPEGSKEADYQQRGLRNSLNGVVTMWGKFIMNALPSDEPLPPTAKSVKPAKKK